MRKGLMKKRLILSILSVVCCAAIFSVGVFASSADYELQVTNAISVNAGDNFLGQLYAKRSGDVIYGSICKNASTNEAEKDYMLLHSTDDINEPSDPCIINNNEIIKQVCFNTNPQNLVDDFYEIVYVFKYIYPEIREGDAISYNISYTNNSSSIPSALSDKIVMTYKYYQCSKSSYNGNDPNWSLVAENPTGSIPTVEYSNEDSYVTFIYVSLKLKATNTLTDAFHLGERKGVTQSNSSTTYGSKFIWGFTISIEPVVAI